MPELPEVERGRRIAAAAGQAKIITGVRVERDEIVMAGVTPAAFQRALNGKRLMAVKRWGKQLWFELDRGPHPLWHFGMTGAFHHPAAEALSLKAGPRHDDAWPPRFLKVLLEFDDQSELAFCDARRFARIMLRDDPQGEPPISKLGFDPLLAMPGAAEFGRRMKARNTAIKTLLLDQGFAAGVGNWIADEVLYQARIDPRKRASDLDARAVQRLRKQLAAIVRTAVAADANDAVYPKRWLFHRRWGKRNGRTMSNGDPIEFLTIGGRTTAWVPARQSD